MKNLFAFFLLLLVSESYSQSYVATESVEYDPINNQWIASNGNSMIADDGMGNLSFFGSSSTGYGLEVVDGIIYGSTGNGIVGVDLTTEVEVMSLNVPGAGFLNGMASDGVSKLYVTDFSNNSIIEIDLAGGAGATSSTLLSNTQATPNGILYDGANNRLLYTTWESNGRIMAYDLTTEEVSTVVNAGVGQIDGIVADSYGNYYISSWSPAVITTFNSDFSSSNVVSTPMLNSPADIGYDKENDVLAIPMGNNVIFVSLGTSATTETNELVLFKVTDNPLTAYSSLEFELQKSQNISINLMDMQGRNNISIVDQNFASGTHVVRIPSENLSSGMYMLSLTLENGHVVSSKVVVR